MIDKNNNLDELDKMLFSYFDNNKDIPSSTQDTILNAFENPKKTISLAYKIQKVAIILISFIILTTGAVFAKDIINFITSLFTNTTEGINKAVENGYVQNVDMDFVYDNDIGIKVDYLVMDDSNLDVSFVYDYKSDNDFSNIEIYEYIIRNEDNNLIYYFFEDNEKMQLGPTFTIDRTRTTDKTNKFRESIIYQSNNFPNSENLIFEIHSVFINNEKITGTWIFNINTEKHISNTSSNTYTSSYNPYIDDISISLEETSLNIDITVNTKINKDLLLLPSNYYLKNELDDKSTCLFINSQNIENNGKTYGKLSFTFDICKYHENINLLNFYMKIDDSKEIDIILSK